MKVQTCSRAKPASPKVVPAKIVIQAKTDTEAPPCASACTSVGASVK